MRYDLDWREEVKLDDGTPVWLRLIRPSDRDRIAEGFARLSPEARYLRFFTRKETLTDEELRYLTEIDQQHHFALGAAAALPDGKEGEGLGIARFVCFPGEPEVAEAAVVVEDAVQRRGLGRILFSRLVGAALERGVKWFRCEVLSSNEAMRTMLEEFAPEARLKQEGDVITVEWPLPEKPPDETTEALAKSSPIYRLLAMVAQGLVVVRQILLGAIRREEHPPEKPAS